MGSSSLGTNVEIVMGQSPPGDTCNRSGVGLPLLNGPTEFGPHHPEPVQFTTDARKRALPGDLLFCVRGSTTGRMNWADREYAIGRGVAAIRHRSSSVLQPLVRGVVEDRLPVLLGQATGSTFPNVSAYQLAAMPWPAMSEAHERFTADVLGAFDDKIELNRRMSQTIESMARALFKSWFVDFDPVRAKAVGSDPGIPIDLADLFPSSFEDSDFGEVPKGWGSWRVGDVGRVVCGKTPSTLEPRYYGDDVPFITIPDMHGKIFVATTQRRLSSLGAASQPNKSIPGGAICVTCIATPGLVAISPESAQTNQQINTVVPDSRDETYFWFWTLRDLGEEIRAAGSGGSVLSNLSTGRFSELRVLAPPEQLRLSYQAQAEGLFSQILASEREALTLIALRDSLLPELVSEGRGQ